MNTLTRLLLPLLAVLSLQLVCGQDDPAAEVKELRERRERVTQQEKEALKEEVLAIDAKLEAGEITRQESQQLKEEAARKRALNIEDRRAIFDREIALLERNNGDVLRLEDSLSYKYRVRAGWGQRDADGSVIFGIRFNERDWDRDPKFDQRTFSDLVIAFGLNNAVIESESFSDTPFKFFGSKFFEIGYAWNTRVFRNSNWLRVKYGLSFQFNGLKSDNKIVIAPQGVPLQGVQVVEATDNSNSPYRLEKSKLRMDSFIFPVHFEFGPSEKREYGDYFRYYTDHKFRIGIGGYVGFRYNMIQKIKYDPEFLINDPVFADNLGNRFPNELGYQKTLVGFSAYGGFGDATLYFKYESNFAQGPRQFRNISLGLRFDL